MYKGESKVTGEYFSVEDDVQEKRPFKAFLDVGLVHTTVGNRVFGALKGATDGGLYIPHNTKRFPGFLKNTDSGDSYDAAVHRDRIFGKHVDNYMASLKEDSQEDFDKQFAKWAKTLSAAKVATVEALYTKVFGEIRKNPDRVKKPEVKNPKRDQKKFVQRKLTCQ
jgi:large subunit ribosomal protein L5e